MYIDATGVGFVPAPVVCLWVEVLWRKSAPCRCSSGGKPWYNRWYTGVAMVRRRYRKCVEAAIVQGKTASETPKKRTGGNGSGSGNDSARTTSVRPRAARNGKARTAGGEPHRDLLAYREEFPILQRKTYLNSCSLGALSHRSMDAMTRFQELWNDYGASAWY